MHPPDAMVFVLTIPVGSTPVPGYRSQKGLRKKQKPEATFQKEAATQHFFRCLDGQNLLAQPHLGAIITENIFVHR